MRYLNKIVFINSATIQYAEVMVDGNVHFIGTQGVGKSTLLRSILFFYNADTLRLGISREKKNFADYYLPYANSYMVYEVMKETGAYCIMAFKSHGKVCYRFIDTAYDRSFFMTEDGTVHDSFDKIRIKLDKSKVDFSNKIDRYEEYRDILYGNNEGKKEVKKYAFLESKQYQNIPRTIQNVFLNSKLEAEFIKETIIHSLADEDFEIKLDTYQYQLKDFEEQLKDIRQFRQPSIKKQADQVADLYLLIQRQKREKLALSIDLEKAYQQALVQHPASERDLQKQVEKKGTLLAKADDVKKRYDNKRDKLASEVSIVDDRLKSIKDKKAYYERLNIESVMERVAKKPEIDKKIRNLYDEKTLLSAQYRETTQKFDAIVQQLDNQLADQQNVHKQQQLQLDADFLQTKEDLRKQCSQLVDIIRKQHQQKLADAQANEQETQLKLTQAEVSKAELKHSQFYEAETRQSRERMDELTNHIKGTTLDSKAKNEALALLQKQFDLEEQVRLNKIESEKEKYDAAVLLLQNQLLSVNNKIDNTKGSLFEWLNLNVKGWGNNIGKVVEEEVLFMSDLAPQVVEKTPSVYGVSLDLKAIDRTAKTADDYEQQKRLLTKQLTDLQEKWKQWKDNWENESEKLRKKTTLQLREIKDATKELQYSLQQLQQRLQAEKLVFADWLIKATTEKQFALAKAQLLVDEAYAARKLAREAIKKIEEETEKLVKAREKEKEQKILEVIETHASQKAVIALELDQVVAENSQRVATIKQQQQDELRAGGADTDRLAEIDQQLTLLDSEQKFIDKNRDTLAEYKKDKRELLDKADHFKQSRQQLQQVLAGEENKFQTQHRAITNEIGIVQNSIQQFDRQLNLLTEEMDEYGKMIQLGWYVQPEYDEADITEVVKRCKELVHLIKEMHYTTIDKINDIKEVINKFLSHFSANNIFKFPSILINNSDYMEYAEKLEQFIEDNRIAEFERRVNERYASIIKLIGKETNELTSSEGEIQKIITRINNDFTQNNTIAVGVIQKIEMKMDESDNKVVQVLKLIQHFNSESGFELGAASLFTQHDSESKNKKAVDLLKQLIKEIQNLRRDTITLSDSFEIKFRIVENKNDTGWVERLANVGSEGTDVLVKAMINIMLLNVFKEGASKRFKDFKLHCMMDEIGRLHPINVRGILNFASARNIWLINGSPTENDALAYRHIYKLEKDSKSNTRVKRILSQHNLA